MAMKPLVITERITSRDSASFIKYLHDVDKIPRLTVDEEFEIATLAYDGDDEAREKLVRSNLRFVISVAKQYTNKGVKLPDLVNEGNLGMIEASYKFNPTKGFKFISYAVHWIRRAILDYITKHSRTIRIPSNQATNITKINRMIGDLEQEMGRSVEHEELYDLLSDKFSESEIDYFIEISSTSTVSLDKPFTDAGDAGDLKDTIESDMFDPTDSYTIESDSDTNIELLLSMLPKEWQKIVIVRHFGLDGELPETLRQIGDRLGITRESTRQIKDRALRILYSKIKTENLGHLLNK